MSRSRGAVSQAGRGLQALLCVLLLAGASLAAAADELAPRIDRLFAAWDKPDSPGAALAVLRDGQLIHSRGYGLAQLEYGVRITPGTVFHVASLSKQFTAFAIQLLVQDGKLALDDEVRKHLPELRVQGPAITLRQLLHHTSGLRDQWNLLMMAGLRLDDVITDGDILGLLWRQRDLNFAPGTEHLYSNSGYTLLAQIVKRVSGLPLATFLQQRVFGPLGMTHSHVHEQYGTLVPGRAYSYARARDGWRTVALSYSNAGATSLFTTVEDLAKWDRNFDDAKLGGSAVQAAMLARGKLNDGREIAYASGLLVGRYRGQTVIEHGGADAGFRSHLLRLPEQRLTVLLLGNAADLDAGALSRRVADIVLEGRLPPEPARSFPAEVELHARELPRLLGEFEMRPGFVLRFSAEGSQLSVQATGQPKFPMFASAPDAFFTKAFEASVRFDAPGADGLVHGATWRQGGRDLPLRRLQRENLDDAALQACAGDYYSDELDTLYRLSWRDGKLLLRYPRGELPLEPVARDRFSAPMPLGAVALRRNVAGQCDGLAVDNGRVRNLQFQRVKLVPVI